MSGKHLMGGLLFAALLTVPALGQAQRADTGWYAGGGVGFSKLKFENPDFQLGIAGVSETKDEKDNAFKLFAGYQVSPHFGAELGYANIGDFAYNYDAGAAGGAGLKYEAQAWTLAGTARVPLGQAFSLFGKLGVSRNTAKLTVASSTGAFGAALAAGGVTQGTSEKKTGSSAYWAVGGQYDLDRSYAVRLEYENFGKLGNEDDTGRAKADMFSVNAVVRF